MRSYRHLDRDWRYAELMAFDAPLGSTSPKPRTSAAPKKSITGNLSPKPKAAGGTKPPRTSRAGRLGIKAVGNALGVHKTSMNMRGHKGFVGGTYTDRGGQFTPYPTKKAAGPKRPARPVHLTSRDFGTPRNKLSKVKQAAMAEKDRVQQARFENKQRLA
jgi:hypothetical protein